MHEVVEQTGQFDSRNQAKTDAAGQHGGDDARNAKCLRAALFEGGDQAAKCARINAHRQQNAN